MEPRPRDLVLAQIGHRDTDPVPYTLGFEEEVGVQLDRHYRGSQWRSGIQPYLHSVQVVDPRRHLTTDHPAYERDVYGSLWQVDRRPFHLVEPGLPEPDFTGHDWPEPARFLLDDAVVAEAQRSCAEAADRLLTVAYLGWGLFESSWGIRGFENVLMDIAAEPDFYADLLDRLTDQFLAFIDLTCDALPDVDVIMLGDAWGHQHGVMVGPERWRAFFKPRYARIYEAVHRRGKLVFSHCCGSVADIIPDIVDIGLDVLESVQPEAAGMNPYELKRRWGDRITFWGCLGSQSTIQFGTPEQIHREVRRLRREMASGGGYILAPAKGLQPGTPIENAAAVVEAITGG